ncbi:MAG: low molecular weight protein-tyrosine-phosphatase [Gammaproteobacteria bacterium]|jgi:protein-tyrosine phosphatase
MFWSRPELRVLFVCTANVCRSPLAEGLLRQRLHENGLAGRIQVSSAGTTALRGLRPDPRVIEVATEAGVPLGRIRSRRLTTRMLMRSDYVLVMDRSQLEDIRNMGWGPANTHGDANGDVSDPTSDNVQLLGHFLPETGARAFVPDIPDPYFGDPQGFRDVHAMIDEAVCRLVEHLSLQMAVDT